MSLMGLLISMAAPVHGHTSNTGYMRVTVAGDSLSLMLTLDITDLERIFNLDKNRDGSVTREELLPALSDIRDELAGVLLIRRNFLPIRPDQQETTFQRDNDGNMFLNFLFTHTASDTLKTLFIQFSFFDRLGEQFVLLGTYEHQGGIRQFLLRTGEESIRFKAEEGNASTVHLMYAFILLGIEHIFIGLDHILFLIGLILLGGSFRDLIKIITAFTLSHSVTLVLATLGIVVLPDRVVESVIALSIMYIAVENFFLESTEYRWAVAGLFGFVHGFGFASVLQDIGLPAQGLLTSLLAFNIGVEIGQIAIVAVVLPMIWLLGKTVYRRPVVLAGSFMIFIFGALWFIERAFGLSAGIL